jgi:hypothetical protein
MEQEVHIWASCRQKNTDRVCFKLLVVQGVLLYAGLLHQMGLFPGLLIGLFPGLLMGLFPGLRIGLFPDCDCGMSSLLDHTTAQACAAHSGLVLSAVLFLSYVQNCCNCK